MLRSPDHLTAQPMKLHVVALAACLALSPCHLRGQTAEVPAGTNAPVPFQKGKVRELKVTVVDEKGAPVSGVTVQLYGMARGGRWPARDSSTDARNTSPWWTFVTDKNGTFVARFAVTPEAWDDPVPRTGRFHFVAELPDGRRAVSVPVYHAVTRQEAADDETSEWEADGPVGRVFTEESDELTLPLKKGRSITGVMVDAAGSPLSGRIIRATHDLHIESRTGEGGDIFEVTATTDAQGRFSLENVHPVDCGFAIDGPGHWARTQVILKGGEEATSRWVESMPHVAGLPAGTTISLRIEMAPKAPVYRYFGRVVDPDGKPLPGLTVTSGVSSNAEPENFGDFHHFFTTTTDAEGRWELLVDSPWVRFLDVRTAPQGDTLYGEDYESDGVGLASPGEYNFTLKRP